MVVKPAHRHYQNATRLVHGFSLAGYFACLTKATAAPTDGGFARDGRPFSIKYGSITDAGMLEWVRGGVALEEPLGINSTGIRGHGFVLVRQCVSAPSKGDFG